jgi:hypothetical protein
MTGQLTTNHGPLQTQNLHYLRLCLPHPISELKRSKANPALEAIEKNLD